MSDDSNQASDPGTERELVIRAVAGDPQATAVLFTRFWRAARASAYAVLRDMSNAEDAAAEAFRVTMPALKRLRDPDRFGPWLRRIVRRIATREAMRGDSREGREQIASDAATDDPADALERREMAVLVSRAVERLPAAEREAVMLFYFEGYSTDEAARFVGIPVVSLRRRLHDGRVRLRRHLNAMLTNARESGWPSSRLQERVRALAATDAGDDDWFKVMRDILLTRPLPRQLIETLFGKVPITGKEAHTARALLTRARGNLFDDPRPVGDTARALRAALSDFEEWTVDVNSALQSAFVLRPDRPPVPNAATTLPGLERGVPGRYLRATRGLLFGDDGSEFVDMAEHLLRSGSLEIFKRGMQPAWMSDVLDAYCVEARPIELAEVQEWLLKLAGDLVPSARLQVSPQSAIRYRTALRLTFTGDGRPAAIGGVLNGWPGLPEAMRVAHVRIYLEPWTQSRTGLPTPMDAVGAPSRDSSAPAP
jgi:RNA polymerase sigma-70 factor (ECF subfamily)